MGKKVLLYGEAGKELIINKKLMTEIMAEYVNVQTSNVFVTIERWKTDENGKLIVKNGEPVKEKITDGITFLKIEMAQ